MAVVVLIWKRIVMFGHQQIAVDLYLWLQVYKADIFKCQQVNRLVLIVGRTLLTFVTVHFATPWIFDGWLCYTLDVQLLVCLNIEFVTFGFARRSKTISSFW